MARLPKRRLALALAISAALAAGAAVALGATGASHPRGHHRHAHAGLRAHAHAGLLAAASSYLALPPPALRSRLETGKTLGQIADATPGRSEAGLLKALMATAARRLDTAQASITTRIETLVRGRPGRDLAARQGHPALRQIVLSYLAIPRRALVKDLRSGMSLGQVADATPGRSATGLREAILAAVKRRLDTKVTAHVLSAGAEKQRLSHLQSHLTALLDRSHPGRSAHAHKSAG